MYWNWKIGGAILGLCFFMAVLLVKPIGVSTQFVVLDGMLAQQVNPALVTRDPTAKTGYASTNAYLNKSGGKYAKSVAKPLNYGFILVVSMILGGLLGRQFSPNKSIGSQVPEFHKRRFGVSSIGRNVLAFLGGVLVLFGARMAGGCTSGHMMSGMMQTAVSGYVFAAAAMLTAIVTAKIVYSK